MGTNYVPETIGTRCQRVQECGTENVRHLYPHMILAVAKDRHFHEPWKGISSSLELHREHGVRYVCIEGRISTVRDYQSRAIGAHRK